MVSLKLSDIDPIWGLYPEEIVNVDSTGVSYREISIAMSKVCNLIRDNCELVLPGYETMSYEEILSWIGLESMFSCSEDSLKRVTTMIPCLLSKYTDLTLGHLVQSVRIIRYIWTSDHCVSYGSLIDFSRIISDVFNEAGLEPKGKPAIP